MTKYLTDTILKWFFALSWWEKQCHSHHDGQDTEDLGRARTRQPRKQTARIFFFQLGHHFTALHHFPEESNYESIKGVINPLIRSQPSWPTYLYKHTLRCASLTSQALNPMKLTRLPPTHFSVCVSDSLFDFLYCGYQCPGPCSWLTWCSWTKDNPCTEDDSHLL